MADQSQDTLATLRAMANRWTMLARDYARDAKAGDPNDPRSTYTRGIAEAYYKAAVELADVLKSIPGTATLAPRPTPASPPDTGTPPSQPAPAEPQQVFQALSTGEVLDIFTYAGTNPRDVRFDPNRKTFTAIFSSWENIQPHERLERVKRADPRLVVVSSGKTRESGDPYIEVGFR
jgi:hypothetical protein